MKVFVIKSVDNDVPLAEIRTDGNNIEFIVDNTGGKLPYTVQGSFERLHDILQGSSHLTMEEPKQATASLLQYLLSNGDVIQITTDGKTALLNGSLLTEQQKLAFFEALRAGQVKVSQKSKEAIPVLPNMKQKMEPKQGRTINAQLVSKLQDKVSKKLSMATSGSIDHDPEIEEADYANTEHESDIKDFWYWLKYGERK